MFEIKFIQTAEKFQKDKVQYHLKVADWVVGCSSEQVHMRVAWLWWSPEISFIYFPSLSDELKINHLTTEADAARL